MLRKPSARYWNTDATMAFRFPQTQTRKSAVSRLLHRNGRCPGPRVVRTLMRAGFILDRVAGSDHVLRFPGNPARTVVVPCHSGRDGARCFRVGMARIALGESASDVLAASGGRGSYPSHFRLARRAPKKKAKRPDQNQSDSFTLSSAHDDPVRVKCGYDLRRIWGGDVVNSCRRAALSFAWIRLH
jgi:predicted RNA binding protein YcfA (HicA-like mRNA interferase family)